MANRWIVGGVIALAAAAAAYFGLRSEGATAEGQTPVDLPAGIEREDLELVVREYILANPEIIPEAMEVLQQRQNLQMISAVRGDLENPYEGAWAGSENADVTIVEFFDYACGPCRSSLADVERLLSEDDNVRVVFRELPILSPESETAARISLTAAQQGEFFDFHRAVYNAGRLTEASIASAQREAGLNASQVQSNMQGQAVTAEIQGNMQLAQSLGIGGTPAFIVGDQILSGAVGYDRLREAVSEARASQS